MRDLEDNARTEITATLRKDLLALVLDDYQPKIKIIM